MAKGAVRQPIRSRADSFVRVKLASTIAAGFAILRAIATGMQTKTGGHHVEPKLVHYIRWRIGARPEHRQQRPCRRPPVQVSRMARPVVTLHRPRAPGPRLP